MEFWSKGKKYDTETMTAKEKIALLACVENDIEEIVAVIAEFNACEDLRAFSVKHFGRDGYPEMYTSRRHVADFLESKLSDMLASDRVKALRAMGCEPCGV
jgi:hypothetical protein